MCVSEAKHAALISFSDDFSGRKLLMLRALKEAGWRVTVIAWDRRGDAQEPKCGKDAYDQWLWVRLPAPTGSPRLVAKIPIYYHKVLQVLATIRKPDLISINHYFLLPLACFLKGKKVYDAMEMYALDLSFYFGPLRGLARPVLQWLEVLLLRGGKISGVSTTDSRAGWLEEFYGKWVGRVQVIWNLPAKAQEPSAAEVEAAAAKYSGRKVVALVGGLMREKGLRVALEAASQVRDIHPEVLFLFMGRLKDDPTAIKALIHNHRLAELVHFEEFLPYPQMLAHLRQARIGLWLIQPKLHYPYISSGNSRQCFTHMQAGIPMVAPTYNDLGLIVRQENCGLLADTTDPAAVGRAITYLLDHPEEAAAMGRRGRNAFLNKYNWEREREKFIEFIQAVFLT